MKKIIISTIIIFFISSCSFSNNDEVQKAKQELLSNNTKTTKIEKLDKSKTLTWEIKNEKKSFLNNIPTFKIEKLTDDQFIEIDDLSDKMKNVINWIEITWKTLTKVDKIEVIFENKDSIYPIDDYILGQFKPWDKNFVYRAKPRFKVLDYWVNTYLFKAYSWDKVSETKVIINIPKNIDNNVESSNDDTVSYEKKLVWNWSWTVYLSFPKSEVFWNPLNVWTDTITYSNIDDLIIKRQEFDSWSVNCSNMTDYLKSKIDSYFYWNTCRDIIKGKWISVYVLKLNKDKKTYSYEKWYFDYNHKLIWYYVINKDIKVNDENILNDIKNKNKELKEKNDSFDKVKVVDSLFKEIIR